MKQIFSKVLLLSLIIVANIAHGAMVVPEAHTVEKLTVAPSKKKRANTSNITTAIKYAANKLNAVAVPTQTQQPERKPGVVTTPVPVACSTIRNALVDALRQYDISIKYWEKQKNHINWYWAQRSPRYWSQDVHDELNSKLKLLVEQENLYFNLLAELDDAEHVDNCVNSDAYPQIQSLDARLSFCKKVPFIQSALNDSEFKALSKSKSENVKIKMIFREREKWIKKSMISCAMPHHIERNWQKYIALGLVATVMLYKRNAIMEWGVGLHASMKKDYWDPFVEAIEGAFKTRQLGVKLGVNNDVNKSATPNAAVDGSDKKLFNQHVKQINDSFAALRDELSSGQPGEKPAKASWISGAIGLDKVNRVSNKTGDVIEGFRVNIDDILLSFYEIKATADRHLRSNALTIATTAIIPIVAAAGGVTYFVGKQAQTMYKKICCCDYEVMRNAIWHIDRILNSSDATVPVNKGKIIFYMEMLKYEAQYMKYSDKVQFLTDVNQLARCEHQSTKDDKNKTLERMRFTYAFLSPGYVG